MKEPATASLLERRLVGLLGGLLLALIVWAVADHHWFQMAYLLGTLALALGAVLLAAAWKHGFRWFFTRRALGFYAWLVVGLLSVIVLFYTEESWRGKRAWAAAQRDAAARGESLTLASIVPPAVPEERNFAQAPGVASLLGYGLPQSEGAPRANPFYHGTQKQWPAGSWAFQQPTDLEAWQQFCRRHPIGPSRRAPQNGDRLEFPTTDQPQAPAADVLLALSRFETNLAILRAASQRPQTRFQIDYAQGFWALKRPDLLPMEALYSAAHVLSLRASAELAQQQSQAALEDVLLAWRLVDGLRQEPFYQAHDYRAQMAMLCLQPIWEGLAGHHWNDSQLAALRDRLSALDWLSDFRQAARGESLMLLDLIDQFQAFQEQRSSALRQRLTAADESIQFTFRALSVLYPSGWLYQDKADVYRFYQQHDSPSKALWLEVSPAQRRAAVLRITDPMFLTLVYPRLMHIFSELGEKSLFLHTACQEAKTACALERYRLAQGQYPDSLEALVPAFLPQEPCDPLASGGAPLRYSRTEDGGFQLYSVGSNQVDDHGQPSPIHKSWRGVADLFPRLTQGDWVWRQPGQS